MQIILKYCAVYIATVLLSYSANADTLAPFVSDGCSAFPDGTMQQNTLWLSCCRKHDYEYWKGGTYRERLESDKNLDACVSAVGEPAIALLMLVGVRVGGTPFLPTKFRWGYGWPYPRLYGPLSESELSQVKQHSKQLIHLINEFEKHQVKQTGLANLGTRPAGKPDYR